jgi:iron complex outermembrane recepter protein
MDYKDLQVTQYDPDTFSNFIGNAASATVSGVEFDLVVQATANLNLSLGLGVLDASFDKFIDQFGVDLKGNELPFAPKVSASLAAQYEWSIGSTGAFVRLEGAYRDQSNPDVQNDARDLLESYTLLNARAGIHLGDGRWTIEAYARNLTDERYAVNRQTQLPLLSFLPPFAYDETTTAFGAPRMYGLKVTTRF